MTATKRSKLTAAETKKKALSLAQLMAPMAAGQDDPFLGRARAVAIVCHCAGTSPSNLPLSLAQLGLNGIPFQKCVFKGVGFAGFTIRLDDIPNSPDTTLLQVVTVIQTAQRKEQAANA
jgi:hypothetical protein